MGLHNDFILQGPTGDSGTAGPAGSSGPRVSNLPSLSQVIICGPWSAVGNILEINFYRALLVPVALLVRMVDLELLVPLDLLDIVVPLDKLDLL